MPPAGEPGPPRVLAGDFNATLDHENLRDLIDTGYRDAGDVAGNGLDPTWPSRLKFPPPVTIDHVLAEPPVLILDYGVKRISKSDHRAVYVELGLPEG
jgi:endonuclease/exonuclease/phosphatase (EEP) superfamily protein YafD